MFGILSNNGATDQDSPRATLESDYYTDNLCGASLESRGLWTLLYVLDDTGIALSELFCGMQHLSHFRQKSNILRNRGNED